MKMKGWLGTRDTHLPTRLADASTAASEKSKTRNGSLLFSVSVATFETLCFDIRTRVHSLCDGRRALLSSGPDCPSTIRFISTIWFFRPAFDWPTNQREHSAVCSQPIKQLRVLKYCKGCCLRLDQNHNLQPHPHMSGNMGDGSQNDEEDVDLAQYRCQCGGMALLSIERFFSTWRLSTFRFQVVCHRISRVIYIDHHWLNIINISHHPAPLQSLFPSISKMGPI